jgi:hypothetical protein
MVELLVTITTGALALSLLAPMLSNAREQARRQQCAINEKKIINAYALWAQDHGGFWPPRCAPDDGCTLVNDVWILIQGPGGGLTASQKGIAYYAGDPGARTRWPALAGEPAFAEDAEDFPLNAYLVPGWQFGDPINTVHCPSDADTVIATDQMDEPNLQARGFEEGDIASTYAFHGSSYFYNQVSVFPWRGYGDWAGSIGAGTNKMQGPNFNPDLLYRPGAFVAGLDMGALYAAWGADREFLGVESDIFGALTGTELGDPVPSATWHESRLAGPGQWLDANAYHADGHVTFARRRNLENVGAIIPIPSAQCFITPEWSLFPLKLGPQFLTPNVMRICKPPSP